MSTTEAIDLSASEQSGPIRLNGVFKVRIIKAEPHVKQSNGNKSIKLTCEVTEPATIEQDGEVREVAGREVRSWVGVEPKNGKYPQLRALHDACGIPLSFPGFGEDGMPIDVRYEGSEMYVELSTTEEQKKDSSQQPMINPATGKALVSYQTSIRQFLPKN